ncbi:hypothetical protein ACWD6P_10850 [Streptomyces sp. NPDC002446]
MNETTGQAIRTGHQRWTIIGCVFEYRPDVVEGCLAGTGLVRDG